MDIIITLPSKINWNEYKEELRLVESEEYLLNFKVNHFPKKTNVGDKCYLLYNGYVIGWMKIVGFKEDEFKCGVTGKHWKGKFIQRSGKFHKIKPIVMKGFQGYRYINLNN